MKKIIETPVQRKQISEILALFTLSKKDLSKVEGGTYCGQLSVCCSPVVGKKTCTGVYQVDCKIFFNCTTKFKTISGTVPLI